MTTCPNTIERKVIDVSGRLGTLYDASRDCLVNNTDITGFENPQFEQHYDCSVIGDDQSYGIIDLLKELKFDDDLFQSILLGTIQPTGVSSFINYSQPINENTSFLYYSYKAKEQNLDITLGQADKIVSLPSYLDNATHMITKIIWGFEILCVIQSTTKESAKRIRQLLYNTTKQIQNCDKPLELTEEEKHQIDELSEVTIFGSKPYSTNSNASLLTILSQLQDSQRYTSYHYPILYTLHPLKLLYKHQQFSELCRLSQHDNLHIAQIEPTIIRLRTCFNDIKQMLKNPLKNSTTSKVNERSKDIPEKFTILLSVYEKFRIELQNILIDVRRGIYQSIEINNLIIDQRYSALREPEIDVFLSDVQQWFAKMKLIERFNTDKTIYINTHDIFSFPSSSFTMQDIDEALKDHFSKKYSSAILWYSSDRLKREKSTDWEQTYKKLTSKRQQQRTQQTFLIYVDFSQCLQKLEDFVIITLPIQPLIHSECNHSTAHPLPSVTQEQPPPISSFPVERTQASRTDINVLLLGETGVGKSTFINAFVNYLIFDTLQQALQSQPIVLIPVSFITTIGDQFDEYVVKFGEVDSNENFEHQGQSVTQQCKSYVFNLNDKLRLRLIDTPGMGDTRGIDQDDKNIHHILTYINNLSHLNAVCLLLKPNTSRLNVFFRSCINQIFTYLTPIGCSNIIFCFTNARSTFYAPGDTGRLLREMPKKEHFNDIPFEKQNTFCFDSESFRYLAARKCGVEFDEFQTQECINSWTKSVTESVRLLNYILTRGQYNLDEWQSPRKCALEISMLARPLMETLRLILYNLVLREFGLVEKEMILNSNPLTIEICSNCAQINMIQVGSVWVMEYEPAKSNSVKQCQCPFDESHFLIEYTTKHTFTSQPLKSTVDELRNHSNDLLFRCDRLIHFLRQKEIFTQNDPFKLVLERFLEEEQIIADDVKNNVSINKRMKEILRSIRQIRDQNKQQLIQSNEKLAVYDAYQIIDQLKSIATVEQQLNRIKTSRHLKMEKNEYQVKLPPIKNKTFSELIRSSI